MHYTFFQMISYYILFLVVVIYAIYNYKLTAGSKSIAYYLIGVLLILFAGFRGLNVDFDYKAYLEIYNNKTDTLHTLFSSPSQFFRKLEYEPSILLIFSTIKTIFKDGFQIAIFLFALLSVSLKMKAIPKMTEFLPYSLILYFSSIYLLQDFTQIRAAVASGFMLLSIPHIVNRDLKKFLLYVALAVIFHYSAIVLAPLYFLNTKHINKLLYVVLIGVAITLAVLKFTPFDFILKYNLGIYTEKINNYIIGQQWEKREINIFNFSILLQIVIAVFFLFFAEKTNNKYAVILTKIYSLGIVVFYLSSSAPVIAFRLSDLLGMVQIILIPFIFYLVKPKFLVELIIIIIALAFFLNQVLINPILHPYKTFLC